MSHEREPKRPRLGWDSAVSDGAATDHNAPLPPLLPPPPSSALDSKEHRSKREHLEPLRLRKTRWDMSTTATTMTMPVSMNEAASVNQSVNADGSKIVADTLEAEAAEKGETSDQVSQEGVLLEGLPALKPYDIPFFTALIKSHGTAYAKTQAGVQPMTDNEHGDEELLLILRLVLVIKNGLPRDRKSALSEFRLRIARGSFSANVLLGKVLIPLFSAPGMDPQERHLVLKCLFIAVQSLNALAMSDPSMLVELTSRLFRLVVGPLVMDDKDRMARLQGRDLLAAVCRSAGWSGVARSIAPLMSNLDDGVRIAAARSIAMVALSVGIHRIVPFIKAAAASKPANPEKRDDITWLLIRECAVRSVHQLASTAGAAVLSHLDQLIAVVAPFLDLDLDNRQQSHSSRTYDQQYQMPQVAVQRQKTSESDNDASDGDDNGNDGDNDNDNDNSSTAEASTTGKNATGIRVVHSRNIQVVSSVSNPQLTTRLCVSAALAVAALAEASFPYGGDSFEPVVRTLWSGTKKHSRRRILGAFLRATGSVIALLEPSRAAVYSKALVRTLVREMAAPDDDMKRIVLGVLRQCLVATDLKGVVARVLEFKRTRPKNDPLAPVGIGLSQLDGIAGSGDSKRKAEEAEQDEEDAFPADYILRELVPPFFSAFWTRRVVTSASSNPTTNSSANAAGDIDAKPTMHGRSGDRRLIRSVIETIPVLLSRAGGSVLPLLQHTLIHLKDDCRPLRQLTLDGIVDAFEIFGLPRSYDSRTDDLLIDGILFTLEDSMTAQSVTGSTKNAAADEEAMTVDELNYAKSGTRCLATVLMAFVQRAYNATGSAEQVSTSSSFKNSSAIGWASQVHLSNVTQYLGQVSRYVESHLSHRSPKQRHTAALVASACASGPLLKSRRTDILLRFARICVENLGEPFPDVLAAILDALRASMEALTSIAKTSVGQSALLPPSSAQAEAAAKTGRRRGFELTDPDTGSLDSQRVVAVSLGDLVARLTPILRNRHERVSEQVIRLIALVADCVVENVDPSTASMNVGGAPKVIVARQEWLRICFDLLELLKSQLRRIRRSAIAAFGRIARAIGPLEVLPPLLANLRVQERSQRVCTTVAIAIVAESCGAFAVLPALMQEYRIPELNVRTGVLKSLAFLFEYLGSASARFVWAVTPLLQDALSDRDLVHRQTASSAVKFLALGAAGWGYEDCLRHLLNFVFPNILEESPHVISAVREAIDALRIALGPGVILQYLLQGLFHPAQKVREAYWAVYNSLYVGSADALVAFYPRIRDDAVTGCNYSVNELEIMI
eukprot:ANDGO_06376.mRNA.1 U2 snRNP component prp10